MATVAEKLQTAIDAQQREVDRLQAVATTELPAAKAKLTQLTTMLTKVTPALESAVAALKANGVKIDT